MAYTKYSLTPANNNATPPDGAPEGMLPSAVNDTMRDMMAQIRDVGDGIRNGTYTMTAPVITGGSITGVALSGNTFTNPVITGGSINNTPIGASTANTGAFTTLSASGAFSANGGATLGDASGDALTINSSAVSIPNGLNFDSNTLVIDAANNRVGVGVASPAFKLDVYGGASAIRTDGPSSSQITYSVAGVETAIAYVDATQHIIGSSTAIPVIFRTQGTEKMRLSIAGNLGIGTNSPSNPLHVAGAISSGITGTAGSFILRRSSDGAALGQLTVSTNDVVLQNGTSANLIFQTDSAERMRITSAGNVGIGTSSPASNLDVRGANGAAVVAGRINNAGTGSEPAYFMGRSPNASGTDIIWTGIRTLVNNATAGSEGSSICFDNRKAGNYSESMRLDSSGNLGLGVTPSAWATTLKGVETGKAGSGIVANTSNGNVNIFSNAYNDGVWKYASTAPAAYYNIASSVGTHTWFTAPSGTAGNTITFTQAMTLDASGNLQLGTTTAVTSNGTNLNIYGASASNLSLQNATSGTGNNNGFQLIQDGLDTYVYNRENGGMLFATNNSERMRITSGGSLFVGTTSASWNSSEKVSSASSTANAPAFAGFVSAGAGTYVYTSWNNAASGTRQHMVFADGAGGGTRGTITTDGANTAYNTSSDYRLKENVVPLTGALSRVIALKPSKWKWIENQEDGEGFVAHELAQVIPQAVTGEKDAVDEEGKPIYQGVDTSFLVATLTAAIQEQQAMIEELKQEVALLKSK